MAKNDPVVSVRLDDETLELLEGIAFVYGKSRSEVIRDASDSYVEKRKADPELPSQIEAAKKRLDALTEGS